MILAGDIGGTKVHLAIFSEDERAPRLAESTFATSDVRSPAKLVEQFCGRFRGELPEPIRAASFGVAGPPLAGRVRGANLPWEVNAASISKVLGGAPVELVNDLAASALGLELVAPEELTLVHAGSLPAAGNRALLSPGTGLGEAILVQTETGTLSLPSEAGHADFAPRTDEEIELFRYLRARHGRVSWERVVSGPGLGNLFRFLLDRDGGASDIDPDLAEAPAHISLAALEGRSELAKRALRMWVQALAAEAGNLALRAMALGGIFLGGGIPVQVLPALQGVEFREAFLAKEPQRDLLEKVSVWVIKNRETTLLGAALIARKAASRI
jgi:glucokinase